MSVSWYWDDEIEDVVVIEYQGTWTWQDNDIILNAIVKDIKRQGLDKVDFITYMHPGTMIPAKPAGRVQAELQREHRYARMVVFVGLSSEVARAVTSADRGMVQQLSYRYQFATCLNQARNIIQAVRST